MTLPGRNQESATLRALLDDIRDGKGRLVLIAGDSGIGKTSLVESLASEAQALGAIILGGHCYDLDTAAPYEPWIDLLRSYRPTGAMPALPDGLGNAELLETLSGKDALYEQVAGFLEALSMHRPAVVILEDMHWSDQASLELLRAMARRIRFWPLLIVATFRGNELSAQQPLHRVLPLLVRETRPPRIDLLPLDAEAIAQVVRERYALAASDERRLVAHLHRYSEGNPFYLEELLRTLEHERLLRPTDRGWVVSDLAVTPVPPLVRQLIDERVARLGEANQRMLQIAAVIGQVMPPDLWQVAAGIDDDAFADGVEAARGANLVQETRDRQALRFTHALVREALYDGVPLLRRRSWHLRVGQLLAQHPDPDPDSVAYHYLQADEASASAWLLRAAQRAERRDASWDAIARYEQALPVLERHGDADALAWATVDLAESYRYVDPVKAASHLTAVEALATRSGDPLLQLSIRWLRARLRGFLGENVYGDLQACVAALDSLSADDRQRLASMGRLNLPSRGLLAQWLAFIGQYDEAIAYAESELAAAAGVPSAARRNELGAAQIALALAHAGLGQPAAARSAFIASREQFQALDASFMAASTLKWQLIDVTMAYAADDLGERQRLLDEYGQTMARMSSFAVFRGQRPLLQVFAPGIIEGKWPEVRESAQAYLTVPAWRVSALAALGELDWRQGRAAAAWGRVRSGIPQGVESDPGNLYYVDSLALMRLAAHLALEEGDLEKADAWIAAHDRWLAWSGRVLDRSSGLLLRARWHDASGDRRLAKQGAEQALALAGEPRQPLALLDAHRFLGSLAISSGNLGEAERHLQAALTIADACGAVFERALVVVEQARLAFAQSRYDDAEARLEAARAICQALGAAPTLEQIASLETTTPAPTAPRQPPIGDLTTREVEVLRLVARGLSYADVGEQLFISPRTVARHLQSIYGKLGLDSRAEAAAFAFEHGLIEGDRGKGG